MSVLCVHLGVACFLDGLYPCLFPSLVMLVGGVVCHPGAVLESVVFLMCFRGWCQGVSAVFCSWGCVFASCDCRETGRSREADPGCFMFAPWCCLFSWMICIHVCFHLLSCVWVVLCVTVVRYWNLLCLVCFRGWCQSVSVVSCSWRCVFPSCDWREKMK